MNEIFRTRDVVVFHKGDAFSVKLSDSMLQQGWIGGQGVSWIDSTLDEFKVSKSDGLYGGILLWGSDEPSDQYISMTGYQVASGYGVMMIGGWLISLQSAFERYTYASRLIPPLVPIVYTAGMKLRLSLNGFLTPEDEWTLSGDPRAPNNYFVADVVQPPSTFNDDYLTTQLLF